MRVLISAFSCEPFRGSESSNGWNWAYELARCGQRVWVITTPAGKETIEQVLASASLPFLQFVYVDNPYVPAWLGSFRALARCLIWQRRAFKAAEKLDARVKFDIVHHVSWSSLHIGSHMWRLGKPFLFGPVGGGQVAPRGFSRYFQGGWLTEFVRSIIVRRFTSVLFRAKSTVSNANLVLVTNHETGTWARRIGAARVEFMLDVGIPKSLVLDSSKKRRFDAKGLKILWVGRLLPRKGVRLALEALAAVDRGVTLNCTIVGDGRQGRYLPLWIDELGLADRVVWRGQVPWSVALAAYSDHDVFLFTSLRDTAGSQLIEAMACGNAIVTLDHQGAHVVVPASAGIKVPVTTPKETVAALARAIERLAREPETLAAMSRSAMQIAEENTWERKITRALGLYQELME